MTDSSFRSPTKSRWDQPNPIQSSSSSSIPTAPKSSRWDQPTKEAPTSSSTSRSDHSSLPPAMPRSQQKSYDSSRDYRDRERDGWKDSRDSDFERRTSNGHDDYYNSRRDSNIDSSYGRSHGSSSRDRDRYEDGYKGKERDYERGGDRRGTNDDRDYYSSSRDRDRRDSYEDGRDSYGRSYSSYHDGGRDDYSSRSYDRNDAYGRDRDRRYDDEDRYYNRGGNRGSYANGSGSNHNSRRNSHERDDEYYRHHSKSRKEERSISRDSPKTDFKDLSIKSEKGYENAIKKEEDGNQRLSSEKMDSKEGIKSVKKEEDLESDSEKFKPSSTSKTNSNPIKRERRSSTSSETDSERSDSTSSTSSSTSSSPRKSKSKSRSRSQSQSVPQSPTKSKSKPIGKGKAKIVKNNKTTPLKQVQLINHLPRAENAALKSFVEIENCTYGRGLGKSRGKTDGDGMICECSWRFGPDPPTAVDACGSDSDCINRLTQVECLESECRCSVSCQNQRFQKREYADVEIVQTEKKGFGIRAGSEIQNDQFIYEYIGEVVPHEVFMKRMQKYKDEGIEHFYFMMLQKDEFLDATKKGGKGRFLNHSCNPNCYVAKWHVGKHMRMGIFAKRDIIPGEELTFNYNVDRYGNDAQECFCGEPNCVGSIGGKTQTDIGGMDDLFINALGIEDEVELLEAKGTKKKKSKHLDDDFNPTLRPMEEEEVPKVMTAVRQATDNRGILSKLLARIHMTDDTQVQKLLVRLHGFSLMSAVLDDWKDDKEIVTLTLGTLARWPLIARNKVVSAGVDQQVKDFCNDKDEEIKTLAEQLVEAWDALEVGYRIAKKEAAERRNGESKEGEETDDIFLQDRRRDQDDTEITLDTAQAPNAISAQLSRIVPRPLGTQVPTVTSGLPAKPTLGRLGLPPKARFSTSHHRSLDSPTTPGTPRSPSAYPSSSLIPGGSTTSPGASQTPQAQAPSRSILEIIRMANENEEKQRKIKEEEAERERERILAEEKKSKRISKSSSSNGKHSSDKDKEKRRREKEKERERKKRKLAAAGGVDGGEASNSIDPNAPMDQQTLERRLEKLVGEIAVGAMSKQKDKFEKEEFKRYAKDLTSTICSKEKKNPKSWPPPSGRLDSFSDEKRIKIKAFSKEWITKLLQRKEEDENSFLRNGMDLDSASGGNATSNPLHSSSSGGSTTTPTDGSSNTTISASISTSKDIIGLQSQIYSNADLNGKELNSDLGGGRDVEMESR